MSKSQDKRIKVQGELRDEIIRRFCAHHNCSDGMGEIYPKCAIRFGFRCPQANGTLDGILSIFQPLLDEKDNIIKVQHHDYDVVKSHLEALKQAQDKPVDPDIHYDNCTKHLEQDKPENKGKLRLTRVLDEHGDDVAKFEYYPEKKDKPVGVIDEGKAQQIARKIIKHHLGWIAIKDEDEFLKHDKKDEKTLKALDNIADRIINAIATSKDLVKPPTRICSKHQEYDKDCSICNARLEIITIPVTVILPKKREVSRDMPFTDESFNECRERTKSLNKDKGIKWIETKE